jgi:outer membrane protein
MKGIKLMALAAVASLSLTGPALAEDLIKDKLYVKFGVAGVLPDESAKVSVIGGSVDISDEYVPSVQLEYFFAPDISVELLCCIAPHKVAAVNTALGRVNLGEITLFPPTVTLKKHFELADGFKPYVGAGVNYTTFFNDELPAGGVVTSIDYDDSFGFALQAGADFKLNDQWYLNVDVRKIWIEPDVTIRAGATRIDADVKINPIVTTIGLGYRF